MFHESDFTIQLEGKMNLMTRVSFLMLPLNNLRNTSHHSTLYFEIPYSFIRKKIINHLLVISNSHLIFFLLELHDQKINLLLMKSSNCDHLIFGPIFRFHIQTLKCRHGKMWAMTDQKNAVLRGRAGPCVALLCFALIFQFLDYEVAWLVCEKELGERLYVDLGQ